MLELENKVCHNGLAPMEKGRSFSLQVREKEISVNRFLCDIY